MPQASLGNRGIKVLTANKGRPGGLEGEVEDALPQPPAIEDLGHIGQYPVATTPIFLDQGQGRGGQSERAELTSRKSEFCSRTKTQ